MFKPDFIEKNKKLIDIQIDLRYNGINKGVNFNLTDTNNNNNTHLKTWKSKR